MIKKIASYIPSVAVPMVINFLLIYLYARNLSPEEYGVLNIYINTISLLYSIGLSFLQSAAFRFYTIKDIVSSKEQYVSTYIIANILVTLLLTILMVFVNLFIVHFDVTIMALSVGVNALYQFFLNMYRLESKIKKYSFARIISSLLTLGFFIGFIYTGKVLTYTHSIIAIYSAYVIVVIFELAKQSSYIKLNQFSLELIKKSMKYGIPMMGVTVMGLIVSYSDQYVILYLLGEKSVGFYSLGYRISDTIISNISMIILLVMTPALMRIYDEGNHKKSAKTLTSIISLNLWFIFPMVFCLMIYAKSFINLIFPDYVGAESIIQLVVFASLFHSLSMFTCKGLELAKETKKMFYYLLLAGSFNLIYNFIFIPIYGINASAHSSIISYVIYNVLLILESRKHIRVKFDMNYIGKILITNGLIIILALSMKSVWPIETISHMIIQIIICATVYLAISYVMNFFKGYV